MSLCRTPVQINTEKARKYDMIARNERANINAIDNGYKMLNYNNVFQGHKAQYTEKMLQLSIIFDRAKW